MSRNGNLLPVPVNDERFQLLMDTWPDPELWPYRSRWLHEFEQMLKPYYPFASAADLRLTARHSAPFPLKDGPNVP